MKSHKLIEDLVKEVQQSLSLVAVRDNLDMLDCTSLSVQLQTCSEKNFHCLHLDDVLLKLRNQQPLQLPTMSQDCSSAVDLLKVVLVSVDDDALAGGGEDGVDVQAVLHAVQAD